MTLENRLQWLPVTPRIDDLAPPSSPIEWWAHGCLAVLCKHKTHSWLRVLVLVCLSACNWIPTERPVTQPSLLSSLFSKISSERLTLSSLWGEGLVRELGIYTYPLLYLKCITKQGPPYSTGNSAQCYVAAWMGGEFGGKWKHVCV